jgi:hypothetical protein
VVQLLMTNFGRQGRNAEKCLQQLASVACSTGIVDRFVRLRIPKHFLSYDWARVMVCCSGNITLACQECRERRTLDGAVVPFQRLWVLLGYSAVICELLF